MLNVITVSGSRTAATWAIGVPVVSQTSRKTGKNRIAESMLILSERIQWAVQTKDYSVERRGANQPRSRFRMRRETNRLARLILAVQNGAAYERFENSGHPSE